MTDKALEAAALAIKDEMQSNRSAFPDTRDLAKAAISAYLSALPGEAEVVKRYNIKTDEDDPSFFHGMELAHDGEWVTLASLQAMQARAEKAEEASKALMDERTNLIETKRQQIEALTSRAEAAERERDEALGVLEGVDGLGQKMVHDLKARVKELEEALGQAEAEASKGLDTGETREALIDIKFTARTALKGGSNG